jgi:ectoine hydroxylase-related dioxygenase (phytanoyl-CoA dioxygenase family)
VAAQNALQGLMFMYELPEPTLELSAEQIEFYHRDGYLSIPAITTPEEVAMMRAAYDRIFSQRAGRDEGNQFDLAGTDEEGKEASLPQILNPAQYAPELKNLLARANGLRIAQQLLGPEATAGGDHAIFKPAHSGAATPWHQDEAYWGPGLNYHSISLWVPLQDVDEANGCMQFIAGSHRFEVLPHQPIGNDPRIHGLELTADADVDLSQPRICPLPAGGATVHGSRMLHFTGANHSAVARRAYIMLYGSPATPRNDNRRFPWQETRATAREERARAKDVRQPEPGVQY